MIKEIPVEGARPDSFMSTRPIIVCDSRGCHGTVEGSPGADDDFLKERAESLGWHCDSGSGRDLCPDCSPDTDRSGFIFPRRTGEPRGAKGSHGSKVDEDTSRSRGCRVESRR